MPKHVSPSIKITGIILFLISSFILGEFLMRVFLFEELRIWNDERSLVYDYHREFGWFPKPESAYLLLDLRPFKVQHNNRGFRDHHHGEKKSKRILFVGDSFVWGYDVERTDRFTEKIQEKLRGWEVVNLGVSGYGTDQTYVLLQDQIEYYKPELVCLIFDYISDPEDNSTNFNYGAYYKPYFIKENDSMILKGVPVPQGMNYFAQAYPLISKSYMIRYFKRLSLFNNNPQFFSDDNISSDLILAMKNLIISYGADFFVGFTEIRQDENEISFCQQNNLACIDLSTNQRYPDMGEHWTPEGYSFVADRILEFLFQNKVVKEQTEK